MSGTLGGGLVRSIGAPWTTWTPTLTNITLGNGTLVANYGRIGKNVSFKFKLTLGSTSAIGTNPSFTLPVPIHADYSTNGFAQGTAPMHSGVLIDNGTGEYDAGLQMTPVADQVRVVSNNSAASSTVPVTSAVPFTWTTSDQMFLTGSYEAA